MVDQNIGGLMAFEPTFVRTLTLPRICQNVVFIIVADFVQPTVLSIYLYQTLIVHFGMRCYFSDKPPT